MKFRRLLFALIVAFAACGLVLGGLLGTQTGFVLLGRMLGAVTTGQLALIEPQGRVLGDFAIGKIVWSTPERAVSISHLRLQWQPARLLRGELNVAALAIERVDIHPKKASEPTPLPTDLSLPVLVAVQNVVVDEVSVSGHAVAQSLHFSAGRHDSVYYVKLDEAGLGQTRVKGRFRLGEKAPFVLEGDATIESSLRDKPLGVHLNATGVLGEIRVQATASEGVVGHAEATITPFDHAPFSQAHIELSEVNPQAWLASAPAARLSIRADLNPVQDGVGGAFDFKNANAGFVDKGLIPVHGIKGNVQIARDTVRVSSLAAELAGGGGLVGNALYARREFSLDLAASRLDLARLASFMLPTRLSGAMTATLGEAQQRLVLNLKDKTYAANAEISKAGDTVTLSSFNLSAGKSSLEASGDLSLAASQAFSVAAKLKAFDPSLFAKLPAARINAAASAQGRLLPKPNLEGHFSLLDSQFKGAPLTGQGAFTIAWPLVSVPNFTLALGGNHVSAKGEFGGGKGALTASVEARDLSLIGLEGGVVGDFSLSGTAAAPRVVGSFLADKLGMAQVGRVENAKLDLDAMLAMNRNESPLAGKLTLGGLALNGQGRVLSDFSLDVKGTNRQHSIVTAGYAKWRGDTAQISLEAQGGFAAKQWSGAVRKWVVESANQLLTMKSQGVIPLTLATDRWSVGPAAIVSGQGWQAELKGSSDATRLHAEASVTGPRLGRLTGVLNTSMAGAWSLRQDRPWQGNLTLNTPELSWLGELIGEGWQTGGHLTANLSVGGTPASPIASGRFDGNNLRVKQVTQGFALDQGVLLATLEKNLLRLQKLSFASPLTPMPKDLATHVGASRSISDSVGRLEVTGETRLAGVSLGDSAFLDVKLDRVGLWQLPDQWVVASGNGHLTWQNGVIGLKGQAGVDAGYWLLPPVSVPRLSDDVVVKRKLEKTSAPWRPQADIDIAADLGRNFYFEGSGLSTRLMGGVHLQAKGRDLPKATGTIRTQGGRFDAYGQKLSIERGILTFNGLLNNPALDVKAVRTGLSVEPGVQVSGTVMRPVVKLISDPEMADTEKLSWLVLGHGSDAMGSGDATILLGAASSLLGNHAGGIVQQLRKTFGFDELGFRQGSLGSDTTRALNSHVVGNGYESSTTSEQIFSVGKRLSSNAVLSYEQSVGKAESVVKLTVDLTRRLSFIGRAGSDNALDLVYTLTFGQAPRSPKRGAQERMDMR